MPRPTPSSSTMHLILSFLLFLTLISSLPSLSLSFPDSKPIEWWCRSTPHPHACRYYLAHSKSPEQPKDEHQFYKLHLQLTYDLTARAEGHLGRLGRRCRTAPESKAWFDCWKLFGNTVLQLNRTLHPQKPTFTALDFQTWLSASLTNLETCRKGFADLGASAEIIHPVMHYNISDLISNCLAINQPNGTTNTTAAVDVPSFTSVANRKLLQLSARPNFIVAKDGSGNFRTIQAALDAAAALRSRTQSGKIVIRVKAGVYVEHLQVVSSLSDLTMVGDGKGKTIITGSRSVATGSTTFSSPTFSVFGDGFIASDITFRNTFGPGSQAVALLSGSDRSIFYRCSFEGYQDTLCVFTQRQFYRECDIYGTVDFIFGNGAVVLQNCNIFARRPRPGESNVITAQGRTDPNQNTGIVIHSSAILPAAELLPVRGTVRSYLGRPWQQYSRTVYLRSSMDAIIDPAGWLPFNGNFALNTLYYAEFGNTGPGSALSRRVTWPGYHVIKRPSLVRQFSVGRFIAGRTWIPSTGVPFNAVL
ncbi:pectinesterase-like [Phoenix dactylifera]|uniref:Pectinesterase n=1 Tax=Phoenix dactylifera TaxID=42345 RepID=A0A8B7CDE8_PHODC|nr:pectinesterase-like [Phoenix dactylifera]